MVKGAIELATGRFTVPDFRESQYSGVYFYSALAPEIGEVIRNHAKFPEIVEYELDESPLAEAKSNADRNGYFLYQSDNGKMVL
jgi:hypothetical protein